MLFLLSFRFGTVLFLVLRRFPRVTRRGSSSGGGQICQNAEIPPSFMSLPYIFCKRMHLQYIAAFLMSTPWGFAPNPSLTCGAAGQAVKPNHLTLWRSVGSAQGVKGKMHGFAALDPLSTSVNIATLTEADGAGDLSRLAKQPLAAWPLQVGGDPTLCGKGAGGFPCTPATWRTRVWAAPTVLARPLGVAQ